MENLQNMRRLIGGIYRIGQIITTSSILLFCTAENRNTNDVVGLFVIEFPPTMPAASIERLLEPLRVRSSMQSQHVLHIHNCGIEGHRMYIATDPPHGLTLRYVMDNEYIDIARSLELIKQVANGVNDLHERGLVGLDLRPQLITVDTLGVCDHVQVDDIGLRSLLLSSGYAYSQQTNDISYIDPRYVPPEYMNQGQVGAGSDVYQLGILLFELVAGRLPFVGRTPADTGVLQSTEPVPRLADYAHDAPDVLQTILECAMAKQQSKRFANVKALLRALENVELHGDKAVSEPIDRGQKSSVALTSEMPLLDDVALRATLIDKPEHTVTAVHTLAQDIVIEPGVLAYLYHEKSGQPPQRILIKQKEATIGRTDPKRDYKPDIDLSDIDPEMTISRQHARIRCKENLFYIEDLKSRNKTRLGELALTPLKEVLLRHGDRLFFGKVCLQFGIPGQGDLPRLKQQKA